MDRKGIAVSQIVLLVLGILVLSVVAYLLYTNFIGAGGSLNTEKCRAALLSACTSWKVASNFAEDTTADPNKAPPWPELACGKRTDAALIKDFGSPSVLDKVQKTTCTNVGIG